LSSRTWDRLDHYLLDRLYQPITDLTWRHWGKTRFFLAWLCFGISLVSLSLDIYTALMRGGAFSFGAVFGSPVLILILTYLCGASASMHNQSDWALRFSAFDRFIRSLTMFSALFFAALSALACLRMGTMGIAKQNAFYIVYGFACSSALYFVEAKPPSARLAWEDATQSRHHGQVRF